MSPSLGRVVNLVRPIQPVNLCSGILIMLSNHLALSYLGFSSNICYRKFPKQNIILYTCSIGFQLAFNVNKTSPLRHRDLYKCQCKYYKKFIMIFYTKS